jgi:prepilin-type N-terminal cleavage/methylation domain-containing protein
MRKISSQSGFSLAELLVAMAIMLMISGAAMTALLRLTSAQATIWNRTQMHSGVRGATEVLQQEVGQAGRIALPMSSAGVPYVVTLGGAVTAPGAATVAINSTAPTGPDRTAGMFVGQKLVIDKGNDPAVDKQETVTVTALTDTTITATFANPHATGVPVLALGAFGTGIVPPLASPSAYAPGTNTFTYANGSTGSVLKLYGDINADGNMVYIEYTCDTVGRNLYRNMMPWNQDVTTKPVLAASQVLLSNIIPNPGGTPCFTYQTAFAGTEVFVTDVAITLTAETQLIDPITKQKQTETKALLNVSPRNTFNAWQMASLSIWNRIQPMPPQIVLLLPPPS